MTLRGFLLIATVIFAVIVIVVLAVVGPGEGVIAGLTGTAGPQEPSAQPERPPSQRLLRASLVPDVADAIAVPPEVAEAYGIRTVEARTATQPRALPPLAGSLALDPNRLANVRARFAGEVVEIGMTTDPLPDDPTAEPSEPRPLRFGDHVEKGKLLAVIWSTELGEKKSELVDAMSQLRLNQETLRRLEQLYEDRRAVPERTVREARRDVEASLIAVALAERTLRSWRLSDEVIEAIKAEAERIQRARGQPDRERDEVWAHLEVRAPLSGTLMEKNIVVGDYVEVGADLFKIADLSRLQVWAHAYEDDLPILHRLPKPIRWTIRLKADPTAPPMEGVVERIGDIIDVNQRTALLVGSVDNSDRLLRAGQFITATIEMPPDPTEVEIPTAALLEDGHDSIVFVQDQPSRTQYTQRRVVVSRRGDNVVFVRGELTDAQRGIGLRAVRPGEPVVVSGAIGLKAALDDLQASARMARIQAEHQALERGTRN